MINAESNRFSSHIRACRYRYGHRISLHDRVYVKLVLNGVTLIEMVKDDIADITSLLMFVRSETRSYKGLARMIVRNISKGWSMQRPLLIHPENRAEEAFEPGHYPMPWSTH